MSNGEVAALQENINEVDIDTILDEIQERDSNSSVKSADIDVFLEEIDEKEKDGPTPSLCDGEDITKCRSASVIIHFLDCYQQQCYSVDMDQVQILNHLFHIKYNHRMNENDCIFRRFYDHIISQGVTPCDASHCEAMQYHYRDRTKDSLVVNALNGTKEKQMKDLICRIHCYFVHSFDINKLTAQEIQEIEREMNEEQKEHLVSQIMAKKSHKVSLYIHPSHDAKEDPVPDNDADKEIMIKRFAQLMDTEHTASALFLAACDWVFTAAVDCFFVCGGKLEILKQKIAERDVYYVICNMEDDCRDLCGWLQNDEYDTDALYYDFADDEESNIFRYFTSDKVKHSKMFKYHKLRHCVARQFNWNVARDAEEEIDDDEDYTHVLGAKESENVQIYNRGVKYWYWDTMRDHPMFVASKHQHLKDEMVENDMLDCSKEKWNVFQDDCDIVFQSNYVKRITANNNEDNAKIYGISKHDTLTLPHVCAIKLYTDVTRWCSAFCSVFRRAKIGINTYESLQTMKQKAQKFAHWARLITEVVQCFGCVTDDDKVFYRGIKGTFTFSSFIARYNVPLSTSFDRYAAQNFAGDGGFMLSLVQYENHHSFHFECDPFSCYDQENEQLFFGGDTILKIQTIHEFAMDAFKDYQIFVAAAQQILRLMRSEQMELNLSKKVQNMIRDLFKHCLDIEMVPNLPVFIANGIFYYLERPPKLNMNDLMKKYQFIKEIFVKPVGVDGDVLNVRNICNLFKYSKYIVISMPDHFILNDAWCSSIYSDLREVKEIKLHLEWDALMPPENRHELSRIEHKFNEIGWKVELKPQSVTFHWNPNIKPKMVSEENVQPTIPDHSHESVAKRMQSIERKQYVRDFQSLDDDECDPDIDGLLELKSGGSDPKAFLISETAVELCKFVTTILEGTTGEREQKYLSEQELWWFSNGYFREIEKKLDVIVLPLVRNAIMKFYNYGLRSIEIRQVPPETLAHVIDYLKHHKGIEPDPLPCPVKSIHMRQIVADPWDATWIDAFDKKTIFEIILAANYMDIKSLLHLGCAKIACLIKQLDQKEINRIIEEEEKYRREHAQNDEIKAEETDDASNEDNEMNDGRAIQSFSNTKLTYKSSRQLLLSGKTKKSIQRIRSLDEEDCDLSDIQTDDEDESN